MDVQLAKKGDREAFGRLVAQYQNLVTSIALSILGDVALSEDVAQDAFLKAWRELPRLRNSASFVGWLRQVTRNAATDIIRARKPSQEVPATLRDQQPDAHSRLESLEEQSALARAVEELSVENREVVILYYREGRSVSQVAALLDLPEATVRKRMSRARVKLREDVLERLGSLSADTRPSAAFALGVMAGVERSVQIAAPTSGLLSIAVATAVGVGITLGGIWWIAKPDPPALAVATTPTTPAKSSRTATTPSVAWADAETVSTNDTVDLELAGDDGNAEPVPTLSNKTPFEMRFISGGTRVPGAEGRANLSGRVIYDGTAPKPKKQKRSSDHFCERTEMFTETIRVGADDGLADVLVYARPHRLDDVDVDVPMPPSIQSSAELRFSECVLEPPVTIMWSGKLTVHNDDKTMHNVHVRRGEKTVSNHALPPGTEPLEHELEDARSFGAAYRFSCDIHPWENATVFVTKEAFATKTDESGKFNLNLVPGEYDIFFMHQELGWTSKFSFVRGPTEVEVIYDASLRRDPE